MLLAAAQLDDWHGDPTWGPRRAMPLVPLALEAVALAWSVRTAAPSPDVPARRHTAGALVLLTVIGVAVQSVGVSLAPTTYLSVVSEVRVATGAPTWFAEQPSECHFIPQFSPIIGHAWLLSHRLRHDRHFEVNPPYLLLLANPPRLEQLWPRLVFDWFAIEWPVAAATGWLALLLLAAAGAIRSLRRRLVLGYRS